jgi:hypothetical protein
MTEQSLVSHLLDGMVKCGHCGTPLETAAESSNQPPKYVCATNNKGCDIPDIQAESFNRLVVQRVINAILDGKNIDQVLEIVRNEEIDERGDDLSFILSLQSREPLSFNLPKGVPPMIDIESPAPTDTTDTMDKYRQEAEADYLERRERAGPYWNAVENPSKVKQYSLNLDTYLRPSNISTTRAIMESSVAEVLAGLGSATIHYRLPLPPGGGDGARSSEEVQF